MVVGEGDERPMGTATVNDVRASGGKLSASDALLWAISGDPILRTTVVAVALFDRSPGFEVLQDRVAVMLETHPRFRARIHSARFGIGSTSWTDYPRFDLDRHLSRAALPAGGDSWRHLLDRAQVWGSTELDPELPLWEAIALEGLADGRGALLVKVNHTLVDGVGGLAMVSRLFDAAPSARSAPSEATTAPPARSVASTLGAVGRAAVEGVWHAASQPLDVLARISGSARTAGRLVAPSPTPLSPVMRDRGIEHSYAVLDPPLPGLRRAGKAGGGTVNDAFVAGGLDGLRRYHEVHEADVDHLRILMPISVRRAADPIGTNRFVPARFVLPLGTGDPVELVAAVHRRTAEWKDDPGLHLSDVLAAALVRLPGGAATALFGGMLKGTDFVATNIPGPAGRSTVDGARLERLYAFAPPSGAAVNLALVTVGGHGCVGVTMDAAAVEDPEVLVECLAAGYDAVCGGSRSRPAA